MLTVYGKKLLSLIVSSNRTSITPITSMHKHCSSIMWFPKIHDELALDSRKLTCKRQVMDCDIELHASVLCACWWCTVICKYKTKGKTDV